METNNNKLKEKINSIDKKEAVNHPQHYNQGKFEITGS